MWTIKSMRLFTISNVAVFLPKIGILFGTFVWAEGPEILKNNEASFDFAAQHSTPGRYFCCVLIIRHQSVKNSYHGAVFLCKSPNLTGLL